MWYARPQLFFNCTLCPTGAQAAWYSSTHKEVSLVYFSTFEPIELTPDSIMQRARVPMLYDSASNPRLPCLYICPVANVLGRAPLIPCFIGGNSHPTIPHRFKDDPRLGSALVNPQLHPPDQPSWVLAQLTPTLTVAAALPRSPPRSSAGRQWCPAAARLPRSILGQAPVGCLHRGHPQAALIWTAWYRW